MIKITESCLIYRNEAKVVKIIVEKVSLELRSIHLSNDESLVGMEPRVQSLEASLDIGLNDIRMIGIKGMGGGGKKTLARAIFDEVSIKFESKALLRMSGKFRKHLA